MALFTELFTTGAKARKYAIQVPDDPSSAMVPAIVVFHGGGQDTETIAARWGVVQGSPVPVQLSNYLLVFPESDPGLGEEWVHLQAGDSKFPTLDLEFVTELLADLVAGGYTTASVVNPAVGADPTQIYAAGFSNGGGMVWQLLNSSLSSSFSGFAAVGKALDPEKVRHYRQELAASGDAPDPAPVAYVHGTADRGFRPTFTQEETDQDTTLPVFTLTEMLDRNSIPARAPATTQLIPGSTGVTEVVVQLFQGAAAFLMATVINGGHNWPTPTTVGNPPVATHFDATAAIVRFWRNHAGLT